MSDKDTVLAEVEKAIQSRPRTASELLNAVQKRCATASSFDVQEAAWRLIERDKAELTPDLKLKHVEE